MNVKEFISFLIQWFINIFEVTQDNPELITPSEHEVELSIEPEPTPPNTTKIDEPKPTPKPLIFRPVVFVSDNIYINKNDLNADIKNVTNFTQQLGALGLSCSIFGYGPNKNLEALDSDSVPDNALVVEIAGGADSASIWEKAGTWYENLKGDRKDIIVFMDTSLRITGLDWLPRAHDDNYSPEWFTGLANPDQYLINNGYNFIEGVSRSDISAAVQFIYKEAVLDSSSVTNQCQNVDESNERIKVMLQQFQDMISRHDIFTTTNGKEPNVVYLSSGGCGAYVKLDKYHEMFKRYLDFYNANNKTYPNFVWIVNDIAPQIISSNVTDLDTFEKMFGVRPNTPEELYDWNGDHLIWVEYYNDLMTNSEIETQISNSGTAKCNCTDQAQFNKPILESMNLEVQFCNGNVKCSDGNWYGHVWLRYRKKGETNWSIFDSVSATTPGLYRPLGNLCCIGGTSNVSIDDDWLYERDQHI